MEFSYFLSCLLYYKSYRPIKILLHWIFHITVGIFQNFLIWLYWLGNPPVNEKVSVRKIISKYAISMWDLSICDIDFVGIHEKFEDPSCLFDVSVHFYGINDRTARFVRIPSQVDIYNSKLYPALTLALFENATHVYEVPTKLAKEIAMGVEWPTCPVTLLAHTGRCGSTLLGNVFSETGQAAVLSMFSAMDPWMRLRQNGLPEEQLESVIECGMKFMLCQPSLMKDKRVCFIKAQSENIFIYPLIKKIFPQIRLLFLYRNGLNTINSIERLFFHSFPSIWLKYPAVVRFIMQARREWFYITGSITDEIVSSTSRIVCAMWASKVKMYLDMRNSGIPVRATSYEGLVNDREKCVKAIFSYCGLDPGLSRMGINALSYDSQGGVLKSNLQSAVLKYEGKMKVFVDAICKEYGVPGLLENVELPGWLSYD